MPQMGFLVLPMCPVYFVTYVPGPDPIFVDMGLSKIALTQFAPA